MSTRFKKMVTSHSKFIALFSMLSSSSKELTFEKSNKNSHFSSLQQQLIKIRSALNNNPAVCSHCFHQPSKNSGLKKHIENHCPALKPGSQPKLLHQKIFGFTVDDQTFTCHLGCDLYVTPSRTDMARHLVDNHTDEELRLWHIPKFTLL